VAQAGLKFMILLPQSLECWDYRCVPPHPALGLVINSFYCQSKIIFSGFLGS
jgi:hypothetical protein